jgi:hypothetical protein
MEFIRIHLTLLQLLIVPEAFSSEVDPVRVKKTRQSKNLELRSDSIGTETL